MKQLIIGNCKYRGHNIKGMLVIQFCISLIFTFFGVLNFKFIFLIIHLSCAHKQKISFLGSIFTDGIFGKKGNTDVAVASTGSKSCQAISLAS